MSATPDRILELGFAFWGSKTLLSAVELGVFTVLGDGPLPGETLRQRLALHPRSAHDFFDALVALGMLDRDDRGYANTPATARFLDARQPAYLGGILEMANARLYPFWSALTEGLRTGRPQNEAKTGGDFFAALYENPERLRQFARAMTALSMGAAQAIARQFPWRSYRTLVDIGTAQGNVPVQVARAHPHMTGIGFDLPPLEPIFDEYVQSADLTARLRFQAGDFFTDPLPRSDVVILGLILHDWDVDQKHALLAKAYDAVPAGGAIIVYDSIIDDDRRANAFGLLMSLNMLIETPGGFDYTGADCERWLHKAGFRETRVEALAGPTSMVVGIK